MPLKALKFKKLFQLCSTGMLIQGYVVCNCEKRMDCRNVPIDVPSNLISCAGPTLTRDDARDSRRCTADVLRCVLKAALCPCLLKIQSGNGFTTSDSLKHKKARELRLR